MKLDSHEVPALARLITQFVVVILGVVVLISVVVLMLYIKPALFQEISRKQGALATTRVEEKITISFWEAPDPGSIPATASGDEIKYGRELIVSTAEYLGPKGKVLSMSNGMNCQNCHLEAGTKLFGNNYSAVASTYPKFRARSGAEETIEKRVNDCFERSLNGRVLAEDSKEMKAIVAYIHWLGSGVPQGESPKGAGIVELPFLEVAADSIKGKALYEHKCTICHGVQGEGMLNATNNGWINPPLWGKHSYNDGAGLFRLSRFAGYIKANMPLGATYEKPLLSDEEAWHIAAYVNSMPRPTKNTRNDWPDISKKPVDHPFGPFTDGFDARQHKFGPFKPIQEKRNQQNTQN